MRMALVEELEGERKRGRNVNILRKVLIPFARDFFEKSTLHCLVKEKEKESERGGERKRRESGYESSGRNEKKPAGGREKEKVS